MAPPESTAFSEYGNDGLGQRVVSRGTEGEQQREEEPRNHSLIRSGPPPVGLFGIRWAKVPGEIDSLNRSVDKIAAKFFEENEKNGTPIPPEVAHVMATGKPGAIYKKRWTFCPLAVGLTAVAYLAYEATKNPATVLASFLVSFLWYDLFSGILHVLHDNPLLLNFPICSEPCLEFQWHHHLPHDLCSKSFLEVCGDLNLIVSILVSVLLILPYDNPTGIPLGFSYREPMALTLVAWKLLMAYFGQLCHSMSHMPSSRRPNWVKNLQNFGVMLHPKEHAAHHKTYDDKFCVGSGLWNGVVTKALSFTNKLHRTLGGSEDTNAYTWLAFFSITLFVDVPLFNYALGLIGFRA